MQYLIILGKSNFLHETAFKQVLYRKHFIFHGLNLRAIVELLYRRSINSAILEKIAVA